MMSDLGDMTMEMLSRLSRSGLKDLSPQDLAKLKSVCNDVISKVDGMAPRAAAASPAPTKQAPPTDTIKTPMKAYQIGKPANKAAEEEADKFFGVDEGPVDDSGSPIKARNPPPHPFHAVIHGPLRTARAHELFPLGAG